MNWNDFKQQVESQLTALGVDPNTANIRYVDVGIDPDAKWPIVKKDDFGRIFVVEE